MKVVEIFNSIEGEGKRTGLPCTFIRLFGCNLACSYCDSTYAWGEGSKFTEMSVNEILGLVKSYGCPNVTVTGGEPLIHKDIDVLLTKLTSKGYYVNVETNGSMKPVIRNSLIFYTVDFKTNASGMSSKMNKEAFSHLHTGDVIKFVVGSIEDIEQAVQFLDELKVNNVDIPYYIYVSPVFGKIDPQELVDVVKNKKLWDWRVQVQLHKIIWNPDERGV